MTTKRKAVDPWDKVDRNLLDMYVYHRNREELNFNYHNPRAEAFSTAIEIIERHRPKKGRKK